MIDLWHVNQAFILVEKGEFPTALTHLNQARSITRNADLRATLNDNIKRIEQIIALFEEI